MIELCQDAGLPEPDFEQRQGSFIVTLWRDWLTKEVQAQFGINERQKQAINHAKTAGSINNKIYRNITNISESTALRELRQLVRLRVLEKIGGTGRAAHYTIVKKKPVINPSNPSFGDNRKTRHKPVKPVMEGDASGPDKPSKL